MELICRKSASGEEDILVPSAPPPSPVAGTRKFCVNAPSQNVPFGAKENYSEVIEPREYLIFALSRISFGRSSSLKRKSESEHSAREIDVEFEAQDPLDQRQDITSRGKKVKSQPQLNQGLRVQRKTIFSPLVTTNTNPITVQST